MLKHDKANRPTMQDIVDGNYRVRRWVGILLLVNAAPAMYYRSMLVR